jgi:LuxR family maltose regulon positive regulatory protein
MRSLAAVSGGSYAAAVSVLDQPEETVPPEAGFARSVQRWAVGYARRMRGDLPEAAACFEEVLRIGYELDNLWTIVTASVDLGAVLRQRGELARAESVYRAGLARATQSAGGPGFTGRLEAFLANLLLERDQLDEAGELIERAIEHNRRWVNPNHCAYAWMVRARLDLLRRQPERAAAALAEVDACAAGGPLVPPLAAAIDAARLRLWLERGELAQANAWLERQRFADPPEQARMSELEIVQRLNAARARLAAGDQAGARELLAPLESAARRGGQIAPLVEARVLQALAAADVSTAVEPLREALTLGLPHGLRQAFLEDGARLIEPLERCQDLPGVSELLARLREQSAASVQPAGSGPLTAREVEILRWVASGLSNPEIGARLYISAGTVKAHTAAIYRKLDVANRAEAIAKAKDLGLL